MKKFIIFSIILFKTIDASIVGNPASCGAIKEGFYFSKASWYNLRLGYEGDFIFDERFKSSQAESVNNFKQHSHSGLFVINIINRLDVFGTFGQAKIESDWIISEGINIFSRIETETKFNRIWSVGAKSIFFEWGNIVLSAGGRYFNTKPKMRWIEKNETSTPLSYYHIDFWQWQVDLGLAYKVDIFIPYIAGKYSKSQARLATKDIVISSDGKNEITMKNKNHVGMAIGCGLTSGKYFLLNLETRLIDEEAFSVSGEFRF